MTLFDLWLPILVAGVGVHVCSFLAWVVLPHHNPEWGRLPLSDALSSALDSAGATGGNQYLLHVADADAEDPAACRGTLMLWGKTPSMGKNIGLTLVYFLTVSMLIGYLASIALDAGASARDLFRFTSTAALMVYVFGGLPHVIWFRRRVLMDMVDGFVYAVVTGSAFALLTPA